jgi:hypothetical protein
MGAKYSAVSASVVLALVLVGCGGGGGGGTAPAPAPPPSAGPTETVSGIVAMGAALAGVPVTARCGNGVVVSGVTDANGRFTISLGEQSPSAFPCMLKAERPSPPVTLYSYAMAEGAINITPLTDLTLAKALGQDPAARFAAFGPPNTAIAASELRDAPQFVEAALQSISAYRVTPFSDLKTPDPFTFPFAVGDDRDSLLDALAAAMRAAGVSYDELRRTVVEKAALREHFDVDLYQRLLADKIVPHVIGITCTHPPVGLAEIKCTITGTNLSRPSGNVTRTGDVTMDIGISISRPLFSTDRSAMNRPNSPSWCEVDPLENGKATFRSTDSDGPQSIDPLGVFAEELVITCLKTIDFTDPLLIQVVRRNAFPTPADWDLVHEKSDSVTPDVGLSRASFDNGNPTCTEVETLGTFPKYAPRVYVAGSATLALGDFMAVFVTRSQDVAASDFAPLVSAVETNFSDGIHSVDPLCNGSLCLGPVASARIELMGSAEQPPGDLGNLLGEWEAFGLTTGKSAPIWVHLVAYNYLSPSTTVRILASNSTTCPPTR